MKVFCINLFDADKLRKNNINHGNNTTTMTTVHCQCLLSSQWTADYHTVVIAKLLEKRFSWHEY